MRAFDPNKNPYADDLVRLALAPSTRYRTLERRALATIMATKLYRLEAREHWPLRYSYHYIDSTSDPLTVDIAVIFDSDRIQEIAKVIYHHYYFHDKLIVLSVGEKGVIEVFNGLTRDVDPKEIRAEVARLRESKTLEGDREDGIVIKEGIVPVRSDSEVADDYRGKRRRDGSNDGGNGGGGGGGGGGDDGPGPDGVPGSGGARELMNHPVLFAVESSVFDAIMEQV
jgi:uncharacterized membrane protein YgcG